MVYSRYIYTIPIVRMVYKPTFLFMCWYIYLQNWVILCKGQCWDSYSMEQMGLGFFHGKMMETKCWEQYLLRWYSIIYPMKHKNIYNLIISMAMSMGNINMHYCNPSEKEILPLGYDKTYIKTYIIPCQWGTFTWKYGNSCHWEMI